MPSSHLFKSAQARQRCLLILKSHKSKFSIFCWQVMPCCTMNPLQWKPAQKTWLSSVLRSQENKLRSQCLQSWSLHTRCTSNSGWVGISRRQPGFAALAGGLCSVLYVTVIAAPPVASAGIENSWSDLRCQSLWFEEGFVSVKPV